MESSGLMCAEGHPTLISPDREHFKSILPKSQPLPLRLLTGLDSPAQAHRVPTSHAPFVRVSQGGLPSPPSPSRRAGQGSPGQGCTQGPDAGLCTPVAGCHFCLGSGWLRAGLQREGVLGGPKLSCPSSSFFLLFFFLLVLLFLSLVLLAPPKPRGSCPG